MIRQEKAAEYLSEQIVAEEKARQSDEDVRMHRNSGDLKMGENSSQVEKRIRTFYDPEELEENCRRACCILGEIRQQKWNAIMELLRSPFRSTGTFLVSIIKVFHPYVAIVESMHPVVNACREKSEINSVREHCWEIVKRNHEERPMETNLDLAEIGL